MLFIFDVFKTLNFYTIFPLISYYSGTFFYTDYYFLDYISFFLFLGAVGKSAQVGLHI
jgi:NADH:ubiquinone oxidoreductase subunit 5 (subunit L)/multisubunit Na+/H+ antiporter MnhA subunit